ncbi:MAG: type II toxin-antitoxin system VapB family antitoxin [Methyloligellaceae bacterium]
MRTNIDIDDYLMNEAMELAGHKTKKETVEDALNLLIQIKRQEAIREFRGKLRWEDDSDDIRTN